MEGDRIRRNGMEEKGRFQGRSETETDRKWFFRLRQ